MLETVFVIVGVIAVTGSIIFFWHFGHYGEWGELVNKYYDNDPIYKGLLHSEAIYFEKKKRWLQWSYCSLTFDSQGIHISQPRIMKYFVPSIFIPYDNIKIEKPIRPLLREYLPLRFEKTDTKIAIRNIHKQKLLEVLNE